VYTETTIYAAPERFASSAPYQIALVRIDDGGMELVRVEGERAVIGAGVREVRREGEYAVFEVQQ
jgi:uncharacterized OB-fold protein